MKKSLPSYQTISNVLTKTPLKLHASQAHGIVCGILCGDLTKDADWKAVITGNNEQLDSEANTSLDELYVVSESQLKEFLFNLNLLLPLDESLPERAEALTLWCQGFLTGLKLVQIPIEHRQEGEMTEAINDIIEIAKMDYESTIESEEDEIAFEELVEYIRMAAILIYQLNHDEGSKEPTKHPLH